jgi:hypothetical protein
MSTIFEIKEQTVTETPLLLFDCVRPSGATARWSTHAVTVDGNRYEARVIEHSHFEIQTASDQGVDGSPKITLVLANADSKVSEMARSGDLKGARLKVSFLFYDLRQGVAATAAQVIFQGICNPPEEILQTTVRLTALNRMNLQRLVLPPVRVQRRCPWDFPATVAQRAEAANGGPYSRFYRCGYSPDIDGGTGSLNGDVPYTSCQYSKSDCAVRGMSVRFGGLTYVPQEIDVRATGKDWSTSALTVNQARYNDFVPMVYGTAWHSPLIVFARNDGNLTRMEALLGIGEMSGVLTVIVNDYEIPLGVSGTDMTGTGWYNVVTLGVRDGGYDLNFTGSNGNPAGDPFGSMAYLAIVVPTKIASGNSLPTVKVLVQGLKVPVYDASGTQTAVQLSSNPAWILLDLLRRTGWSEADIDLASFYAAAAYCDELIDAKDLNGTAVQIARFQCNLVIKSRKSCGDVVRGIRNASRLYLTYGISGALQLRVENTIALNQPVKPEGSNSTEILDGGWPSCEFGDGSTEFSGMLRRSSGEPSLKVTARGISDTPNRYSVEFQDSLNSFQQDSYSMVDPEDVSLAGQEVSATLPALGLANYDQAARMLRFFLDKSISGNTYIEFETSVKAFGVRPGDLISVTYEKEGFDRQPFRVLKIAPTTNYRTAKITAQIHEDVWYSDTRGQDGGASGATSTGSSGLGVPKPLIGSVKDDNGDIQFGISESADSDDASEVDLTVSFTDPGTVSANGPGIPLLSLIPVVGTGGTITGGSMYYYGLTSVDSAGQESKLSFLVRASVHTDGGSVTLQGLSFPSAAANFNVYRGTTPARMFRIASSQALAASFTDTGLEAQLVAAPDANYDHANFYWRRELQPEVAATQHAPASVGSGLLSMVTNEYRGMVARITRGIGMGQERAITANDAQNLTVSTRWTVEPDATSYFVIAEPGWQYAAVTKQSPVTFRVVNRTGETVEISGRSANVNDVECPDTLSPVTRWQLGSSGTGDAGVPPTPFFGLAEGRTGGTVELSGVSFGDLTNTRTITSATLRLRYWNELLGTPAVTITEALAAHDTKVQLSAAATGQAGTALQIGNEVMLVSSVGSDGASYVVERGALGSTAATHDAGATVYQLADYSAIAAFPVGFFGSLYSGEWSYPVLLPDARVATAELYVTNRRGNSDTRAICLTSTEDLGLRTLSGGQYSIEVGGYLAVDESAAPAIIADATHAVRDVYAVIGKAADLPVEMTANVDGEAYCALTIETGNLVSNAVSGKGLAPLKAGSKVTLAITGVGSTYPGGDLTVVIRF